MSFTWINKQGVESNKGFVVQCTGQFTSEYKEGARKITVEVEIGELANGKYCEIIDSSAFARWDDGEVIPKNKQDEILQNYKDAKAFQSITVIVQN